MNRMAPPFSGGMLAAALAWIPGALFMVGCTEDTNLAGSISGTGGAGAGGVGGTGATGATGGSSMGGGGLGGSGMGGSSTGGTGGNPDLQCGNGILDPGESCDDGNAMDGDACPASCLRPATKLTVSRTAACALLDDGRLKCWGGNQHGLLGLGDWEHRGDGPGEMGDNLPAVDLGAGETVVAMGATLESTCAVLDGGRVKCWGRGDLLGQGIPNGTMDLGDDPGDMGDNLPEVDLGTGESAVDVKGGHWHHCAILTGGSVKCWGRNKNGQLGLGDTDNRGDGPGEMGDDLPAVDLGAGKTAVQLALGNLHTCALLNDGHVKCWGGNDVAQLGLPGDDSRGDAPGEMGDNLPAVDLGAGKTAVAIGVGWYSTCAILDDGKVKCWGDVPTIDLGTGKTAVAIAMGGGHACAILNDGSIKCWGHNDDGELGLGDTKSRGAYRNEMGDNLPAVDLGAGMKALAVATKASFTCALLEGGRLKCWGRNGVGQLGLGDTVQRGDEPGEMGDNLPFVAP